MIAYSNSERFRDNLRILSERDPALGQAMARIVPATRLVTDGQGGFNLDLGGDALLYPQESRISAQRQVEDFLAEPLRLGLPQGEVYDACTALNRFIRTLDQRMASAPRAARRAPFAGYAVVFGLGLGHHVELLAQQLDVRSIIVIEPHDEMIHHSLHVLDWGGLTSNLEAEGRQIRIIRGDDLFAQLIIALRGRFYPYADGSYLYSHYQSDIFADLSRRLLGERDLTLVEGWFEDQILMLRNSTANVLRPGFYAQKAPVPSPRALPAFVVGAGPSLDLDIEDIRRLRDDVVLISASSALGALLDQGIRPDIHCELENISNPVWMVEGLAARHGDLSDIVLYASATVDPRLAPFFKTAIYFFRPGLSSTALYGADAQATPHSDPTSGNTALQCALSLGFRQIYLFGMDFGSRDPDSHHSQHSLYVTRKDEAEIADYVPYDFNERVPGNFGGEISSGWLLNWGRRSMTEAIQAAGKVRVMNCSDGSLIPLTTPVVAEALDLPQAPLSPSQDLEQALAGLTFCPEPMTNPQGVERLRLAFHQFLDGCLDLVAATDPKAGSPLQSVMDLGDGIIARLAPLEQGECAVYDTLIGHMETMLARAFHHASTLAPEAAADVLPILLVSVAEGFRDLKTLIDQDFAQLGSGMTRPE